MIVLLGIIALIFIVIALPQCRIPGKAKEAEVKQNLYAIQLAIERYAAGSDGKYPQTLDVLHDEAYMPSFPGNPFSQEKMKPIALGETPFQGNFTYLRTLNGYKLYAYGYERDLGMDVNSDGRPDHVILVLENGQSNWNRTGE